MTGSNIYKSKTNFDYPLKKDKNGDYKIKSGEQIMIFMLQLSKRTITVRGAVFSTNCLTSPIIMTLKQVTRTSILLNFLNL